MGTLVSYFKSFFFFPIFLLFVSFYYLSSISSFFVSNLILGFFTDEYSLFLIVITIFLLYISYLFTLYLGVDSSVNLTFSFILLCCFYVFCTDNMFYLYLFYEASLVPILYIIIKWGSYADRALRSLILLLYTAVFTFPFLYFLFTAISSSGTSLFPLSYLYSSSLSRGFFTFIIFLTFAVKLPIYGLHFWLPMAHVEAPTFGSIILAGVLLKLGGIGLIRFSQFLSLPILLSFTLSYFMVGLVFATTVCCFQADFKRLVAYSSVRHIITIPFMLLSFSTFSFKSIILVILFHGLSSPLLFMLVGVTYSIFSSRQLLFMRGLGLLSPLLSLILILAFFFTLSAPPFPSFFGEVFFMVSRWSLTPMIVVVLLVFAFLSLVYNLNWLSRIVFFKPTFASQSYIFNYLSFLCMLTSIILGFLFMLLLTFF